MLNVLHIVHVLCSLIIVILQQSHRPDVKRRYSLYWCMIIQPLSFNSLSRLSPVKVDRSLSRVTLIHYCNRNLQLSEWRQRYRITVREINVERWTMIFSCDKLHFTLIFHEQNVIRKGFLLNATFSYQLIYRCVLSAILVVP